MRKRLNIRDPTDFELTTRCLTACGFLRNDLFVRCTNVR